VSVRIRSLFALVLSGITLGITLVWYHLTSSPSDLSEKEVLAEVTNVKNEVSKKPKARLIWRELDIGDHIGSGEAIRTQSDSDVKIRFKDGTELLVEPDTLIILSKRENRIGLNLLEGALLANNSGSRSGPNVVLESNEGAIELGNLSNALISIDKNEKLTLISADPLASSQLSLLKPKPGSDVFFTAQEKVSFSLRVPEGFDFRTLKIWMGSTRKNLIRIEQVEFAGANSVLLNLKAGSNYIKFSGQNLTQGGSEVESPVFRVIGIELKKPEVVFPKAKGEFRREAGELSIIAKIHDLGSKSYFNIKGPNDFRTSGTLDKKGLGKALLEPGGPYYLIVTTRFNDNRSISSDEVAFIVLKDEQKEKPPFDLKIENLERELFLPLMPNTLKLSWSVSVRHEEIGSLKIKVTINGKNFDSAPIRSDQKWLEVDLKEFGDHQFQLVAYSMDGEQLAISESVESQIKPTPLIGPVTHDYKQTAIADGGGNVALRWNVLEDAKRYRIYVKQGTSIVSEFESEAAKFDLASLMPGEFEVIIIPIDQWNRAGVLGDAILIKVPDVSSIRAPSGKKVNVR